MSDDPIMEPRGLREAIKVNNTVLWMTPYLLVDQNDFGVIINLKFLITVRSLGVSCDN